MERLEDALRQYLISFSNVNISVSQGGLHISLERGAISNSLIINGVTASYGNATAHMHFHSHKHKNCKI
uniref:Uncharacterized protein n=1 Tax=Solanum lycopersicum TaxID=4081 RepID=A0A3Q7HMR8_SOLLC